MHKYNYKRIIRVIISLLLVLSFIFIGVPAILAVVQDLTTYTEPVPSGFLTISSDNVVVTAMTRPGTNLYYDFGVDYFGTTISEIKGSVKITANSGTAVMLHFLMLSNSTTSNYYTDPAIMCYAYPANTRFQLTIDDNAASVDNTTQASFQYVLNTQYWYTFTRDASGCVLKIYSDATRLNLLSTLTVQQGATSFRYLHVVAPLGNAGTNTISGVVYAPDVPGGVVSPTVSTISSSNVEYTTADATGNITDTGGENCDIRGIQWGTVSGVYTTNVTESGSFGTGLYTLGLTGLPDGTTIYYRAEAHNSDGWGYGAELSFTTKAIIYPPTNFNIILADNNTANLTWVTGVNALTTYIRVSSDHYPNSLTDGTLLYSGNLTTYQHLGLAFDTIEAYYSAWGENTGNYSATYVTGKIGGQGMIYFVLFMLPLGLTIAMFATKKMELGFPSLIFWAISGAYCYQNYTTAWVDWQYYGFFASFGMVIFSALAMYGLRDKKKTLGEEEESDKYYDEGKSETEQKISSTENSNEKTKDDNDMFSMESNNHKDTQISKGIHRRVKERREGKRTSFNISK